jgi:hypothetical protein
MWCVGLRILARNDVETLKIRVFCSAYKPAIANGGIMVTKSQFGDWRLVAGFKDDK